GRGEVATGEDGAAVGCQGQRPDGGAGAGVPGGGRAGGGVEGGQPGTAGPAGGGEVTGGVDDRGRQGGGHGQRPDGGAGARVPDPGGTGDGIEGGEPGTGRPGHGGEVPADEDVAAPLRHGPDGGPRPRVPPGHQIAGAGGGDGRQAVAGHGADGGEVAAEEDLPRRRGVDQGVHRPAVDAGIPVRHGAGGGDLGGVLAEGGTHHAEVTGHVPAAVAVGQCGVDGPVDLGEGGVAHAGAGVDGHTVARVGADLGEVAAEVQAVPAPDHGLHPAVGDPRLAGYVGG